MKKITDKQILDWLEKQGAIGIGHIAFGEYCHYAGKPFLKTIREIAKERIEVESAIKSFGGST